MTYPSPILTVDVVAMRLQATGLEVALTPRQEEPYKGVMSLPGGFVRTNEDENTDATALRVLNQKMSFRPTHMEQVMTVSGAGRDPRGWSASVVYMALVPLSTSKEMGAQSEGLSWFSIDGWMPPTGFDHKQLVMHAFERLKAKAQYTNILSHLMEETFAMSTLHEAHQIVLGKKIDRNNFRRKALELGGIIPLGVEVAELGRPRTLYKAQKKLVYS